VAHACNPSYSGGRDQEDGGSKPGQANSICDPISINPGRVAQDIGPEFKSLYWKEGRKERKGKERKKERKKRKKKWKSQQCFP
jgi:hypothetical protein